MNLSFKKDFREGLFIYHFVTGHSCNSSIICVDEFERSYAQLRSFQNVDLEHKLDFYLSLASFLMVKREIYVIIRYTPFLGYRSLNKESHFINWQYEVLANDYDGLVVDKGFTRSKYGSQKSNSLSWLPNELMLLPLDSLSKLSNFPEDAFGDSLTNISIFGMGKSRAEALLAFLKTDQAPPAWQFSSK